MSFVKSSLRTAKDALINENYGLALECANDILEEEPTNYTALVFKGKALDRTGKIEDSAFSYKQAIKQRPNDQLAWKGLLVLYEDSSKWKEYLDAFVGYVGCCQAGNNVPDAFSAFTKIQMLFRSKKVDEQDRIKLLKLQLPGSPVYEVLQSCIVDKDEVLSRLIKLIESYEKKLLKTNKNLVDISSAENDKRAYTVMSSSELPGLYEDIIHVTHNDSLRRTAEENQFYYYLNLLRLCPNNDLDKKKEYRDKVLDLISGIMVVKALFPVPWTLGINWTDAKTLEDLNFDDLVFYVNKFDFEGTAKVLTVFLHSKLSPFPIIVPNSKEDEESSPPPAETKKKKEKGKENNVKNVKNVRNVRKEKKRKQKEDDTTEFELWPESLVLELLEEGLDLGSNDILSFRIAAEFYLQAHEYETAADISLKGIAAVRNLKKTYLIDLPNALSHLNLILATSYVYYDAPKHHSIATKLFDNILKSDPENIDAQVGKGLIYREQGRLSEARALFKTSVEQFPENYQVVYEYSVCLLREGYEEEGRAGLEKCLENVPRTDLASADFRAKIGWELSNSYWIKRASDGSATEKAFEYLVKILQENSAYGPAYTSLGNYYSEIAKDPIRASKCYYKAFELDSGEIEAAEKLAEDFASKSEWDMVEVVANRVVNSDKIRQSANNYKTNWPYRALGVISINHKNYAQAVGYFQKSLRLVPKDANSWIGLGESYVNSGRYSAGSKAFERALSLDPKLWYAEFQLALVEREMYHFEKSIDLLRSIFIHDELKVGCVLIEVLVQSAYYNFKRDYYGDAITNATAAIEYSRYIVSQLQKSNQHIWECVASATELFLQVQSLISSAPINELQELINVGSKMETRGTEAGDDETEMDLNSRLVHIMVSANILAEAVAGTKKRDRALAAYNLGLSYLKAFKYADESERAEYLENSIANMKQAIQLEPRNEKYWNSYGLASAHVSARVSQHCFIRSLRFNENQPDVWCNLGALYLSKGDRELAIKSFDRAQGIDPENAYSWLGNALVNFTNGDLEHATNYFEQSFLLSKGNNSISKLLYGLSLYETNVMRSTLRDYHQNLDSGVLGLEKMLRIEPNNHLGLAIQGSLLEREGSFKQALIHTSKLCELIEEKYERFNLDEDIEKFAVAKSQLARLYLGCLEYEKAVTEAETAMNISDDSTENLKNSTLSAVLTAGLACFFLGRFDESLEHFKRALETTNENIDVIVLLVQVLWAQGGEDARDVAIEQLYGAVGSTAPNSVKITVLLGIIGLLGNGELKEAAEEELDSLSFDILETDLDNSVPDVLSMIKGNRDPWQKSAVYWPTNYNIMRNVDKKLAFSIAKRSQEINSTELSDSYVEADKGVDSCQMGVFLAPWNTTAWQALENAIEES